MNTTLPTLPGLQAVDPTIDERTINERAITVDDCGYVPPCLRKQRGPVDVRAIMLAPSNGPLPLWKIPARRRTGLSRWTPVSTWALNTRQCEAVWAVLTVVSVLIGVA